MVRKTNGERKTRDIRCYWKIINFQTPMIPVKLMYQNSKNTNNSFVIVGRYDYIILKKMYKHILDADIIRFFLIQKMEWTIC